jgi:hypothetical protein
MKTTLALLVALAAIVMVLPPIAARADDQVNKNIVSISKYVEVEQWGGRTWRLSIQSRSDLVTITRVAVNRGNCEFIVEPNVWRFPVTLRFGQTMSGFCLCNPIEVDINTTVGDEAFSWDN